jgi:hypothetical protein
MLMMCTIGYTNKFIYILLFCLSKLYFDLIVEMGGNLIEAVYFQLNNPYHSMYSVANHYSIHHELLARRIRIIKPFLPIQYSKRDIRYLLKKYSNKRIGGQSKLNEFQEQQLVKLINMNAERGTGLTPDEVREAAAKIINKDFNNNNNTPISLSLGWYYSFMNRNPTLSIRDSMPLTAARAAALTTGTVDDLFHKLNSIYTDHSIITPNRIFNLDEKGFDGESIRKRGIVAPKSLKHCNSINCGWREHWSCLAIVNAAGYACPPLFVFTGKEVPEGILNNGPINSKATVQENGYFTQAIFQQVIDHLLQYSTLIIKPIVLIFDGSDSHLELNNIQYALDNGIIMLQLPAQTTHRLQPLDISVFKPFSDYWKQSVKRYKHDNNIKSINKYNVAECIIPAWEHATVPSTIISGFRNCGYWPLNRSKITLTDCSPAKLFNSDTNKDPLNSTTNPGTQDAKFNTQIQNNINNINNMNIEQLRDYSIQIMKDNIEYHKSKFSRRKTLKNSAATLYTKESLAIAFENKRQQQLSKKSRKRKNNQLQPGSTNNDTKPSKKLKIQPYIITNQDQFKLTLRHI